jgi:hypothetical protein
VPRQLGLARVQAKFPQRSDSASSSGKGGGRTHKATHVARLFSGQVPSPIGWPFQAILSYPPSTFAIMSEKLEESDTRICRDCGDPFTTVWATRLCMTCKYDRASRSLCEVCGQKTGQTGRLRCGPCRYGPDPLLRSLTDTDRAWLAGIVEGEGTFSRPNSPWGLIRVVMTDKDVASSCWPDRPAPRQVALVALLPAFPCSR